MTLIPDQETAKRLNDLAREQLKTKLMNDILIDMTICKIEGWDIKEYLQDLKNLIDSLQPK
jgi:5'(3')-deoxyribonucleotidase